MNTYNVNYEKRYGYLDKLRSDVASKFNISKARVSQMVTLVTKLPKGIIDFLANQSDPQLTSYLTKRKLRPLTLMESDEKKELLY